MNGFDPLEHVFPPDRERSPREAFAHQLRLRLDMIERRERAAPDRQSTQQRRSKTMSTITPYLTVTDGRAAIEFYREVFGAEVVDGELFEMGDGRIGHASLKIGTADLYLADEFPEMNILGPLTRGGGTVAIVIEVDDADETYAHAVAAGATADRPVVNQHGARSGWFSDPWGHRWSPTSPEKPGVD